MGLVLPGSLRNCSVDEGYMLCAKLASSHYENFTVASWFLPRKKRAHIYAIYAFCRFVDDLGDEYPGDRLAILEELEADLRKCYSGSPQHPYLVALQQTIRQFEFPVDPFLQLIEANRMDQTIKRYPTYEALENYCAHSANPVGRIVLQIFGYQDSKRQQLSDATCTALQLTNFLQDIPRDFEKGRIYIPQEDMESFGYSEEELARNELTTRFQNLMAFEVTRTRELFRKGEKLSRTLKGWAKLDITLFTKGGVKVLDAIENQNYDVYGKRPVLSKAMKFLIMLKSVVALKIMKSM